MAITEKILHTAISPAKIIDADYHAAYGLIVAERRNRSRLFFKNSEKLPLSIKVSFSKVRWMTADTIVLAKTHAKNERDQNIHIVSLTDGVLSSFHGGDCIQDIMVTKDGIWVSYFDQGVYGEGISTGGLVLFNIKGDVLYRFNHDNKSGIIIDDCYAICPGEKDNIWLFPYNTFHLVRFSFQNNETAVFETAEKLHGAHAVAVHGQHAYFHGSYDYKQNLLSAALTSASQNSEVLDYGLADGRLRGLPPECEAAFIQVSTHVSLLLLK